MAAFNEVDVLTLFEQLAHAAPRLQAIKLQCYRKRHLKSGSAASMAVKIADARSQALTADNPDVVAGNVALTSQVNLKAGKVQLSSDVVESQSASSTLLPVHVALVYQAQSTTDACKCCDGPQDPKYSALMCNIVTA